MLSVVSTIPGANTTGAYIDQIIKVKFNEEVADVSLAKTIFNLYAATGTLPNETYSAASVTYSKNPNDHTEVWISPQGNLLSNQKYMLLIKGDPNTADATKVGVLSSTNDVMSGNYSFYFTTGNAQAPAPTVAVQITTGTQSVDANNTTTYTTVDGFGNIVVPTHLEVIGTIPENLFSISNLPSLRILFNEDIEPTYVSGDIVTLDSLVIDSAMPLHPLTIQSIEISGNYIDLVFGGQMASSPDASGTCIDVYNDPVNVPGSDGLANNHRHRVFVNAGTLKVVDRTEILAENFQIQIDSALFPFLCSIYEARASSHGVLTEKVPDDLIGYWIFHNSKMIMDRFGLYYNMCSGYYQIASELMFYFQHYVKCQSVYDAGRTIYNITDRFRLSSKHLGDMSIGYSNPSFNSLANPLSDAEKCAQDMWIFIMAKMGASIKTPVKSQYAETKTYPGRMRTEFMRRPIPDPNMGYRDRLRTIRYFEGYF